MLNWFTSKFFPNSGPNAAAKLHAAAVQAAQSQPNWTEQALRRLNEWEASVNGLCFAGVIGTGDAVLEIEHIARIRAELSFRVNDPQWNAERACDAATAQIGALVGSTGKHERPAWKPGVEHQQPHPVKENADGTLYYKGRVYRMVGDHAPKKPKEQPRRRHWKKAGKQA